MSSEPPPLHQSGPLSFKRYGCLVLLVGLVVLIVGGVLLLRYVVVDTAIPFNAVASIVQKANPKMKITGISGDLSSGPRVQSITWGDDPTNRSEILDLRVKYNGYADAGAKKRVIISDVGVRKAHIDLADFGAMTRTKSIRTSGSGGSDEPSSGKPTPGDFGLESFEIQQVLIEDVLVTNRHSDFRLSIPKISWTGFKATRDTVEAGEINVESDRVELHTIPGRTLPLGQESVTFQKTLVGKLQPLLHPAILQPISFTVDYTFVPEIKTPAYHFSTADGRVEMATTVEGGETLHIKNLDLAAYFDARKLYGPEAAEFPGNLVLDLIVAPAGGPMQIVGGSFQLGKATFQVEPAEIPQSDFSKASLQGLCKSAEGEIRWSLPLKDWPMQCRPAFTAQPEMAPGEILARVFAGKKYEALDAQEKKAVDARLPVYFSTTAP